MSEEAFPSHDLRIESPVVTRFGLRKTDLKVVFEDQWKRARGGDSWALSACSCLFAFVLAVILVFDRGSLSTAAWWQSWIAVMVLVAAPGAVAYRARVVRARVLETAWKRIAQHPLAVEVIGTNDSLCFQRGSFVQALRWADIISLRLIDYGRLWVAQTSAGNLLWIPAEAFQSREEFEETIDAWHDQWVEHRPTRKGFEVVLPNQQSPNASAGPAADSG